MDDRRILHFNQTKHLKIKTVGQVRPGSRLLMVHDRPESDFMYEFAPPSCGRVWAVGIFVGPPWQALELTNSSVHSQEPQSWLNYIGDHIGQYRYSFMSPEEQARTIVQTTSARDNGFEDENGNLLGHDSNWVLDLDLLEAEGYTILETPAPGTDMTPTRRDDWYDDLDDLDGYGYGGLL